MANIKAANGRFRNVSQREARAAAKVKVATDRKLGKKTEKWVKDLAENPKRA